MVTDRMSPKTPKVLSGLEDAPQWAVDYVRERRQLYGSKPSRSRSRADVKRMITTLKKAEVIFRQVAPHLSFRSEGRTESTIKDLQMAADALATLLTPGRVIDTTLAATVMVLSLLYIEKTGKPHYPDVGLIVTEIFKDVLPAKVINGDVGDWARKTATRYRVHIKALARKNDDATYAKLGKAILKQAIAIGAYQPTVARWETGENRAARRDSQSTKRFAGRLRKNNRDRKVRLATSLKNGL